MNKCQGCRAVKTAGDSPYCAQTTACLRGYWILVDGIEVASGSRPKPAQSAEVSPEALSGSDCVQPICDEHGEFHVDDPELELLLNFAADIAKGKANMDTGVWFMNTLEAVQQRLAPAVKLPAKRKPRAADRGEPPEHTARREGYDEGWNECVDAVHSALSAAGKASDPAAFFAQVSATPEKARAFLQSAGILDEEGELAEPYRTPADAAPPGPPLPACEQCAGTGDMLVDGTLYQCDNCSGTGVQMDANESYTGQKGWKLHRCPDGAQCRATVPGGCASGWCGHFEVRPENRYSNIVPNGDAPVGT